ncbi:MAG: tail fiber domain-containing protein [Bacteroidota bacterium]
MKATNSLIRFMLLPGVIGFINHAIAQNVGINTPGPTSALDVNGGLRLRPQSTTVSGNTVVLSSNRVVHLLTGGTQPFDISFDNGIELGQHLILTNNTAYNGTMQSQTIVPGSSVEFIYNGGSWRKIGSSEAVANTAWSLNGNNAAEGNFIGTNNNAPLLFKVNGGQAGGVGRWGNVILGEARDNNFFNPGTSISYQNTAIGNASLKNNTNMVANTAVGFGAAENNMQGYSNTAMGHYALRNNKNGDYAVAIGKDALLTDTAAGQTVAVGGNALYWNNNRFGNTAVGTNSLFNNSNPDQGILTISQGLHNTALGHGALFSNRSGSGVVAIGFGALYSDTKADGNIAIGRAALYNNNSTNRNIAIGDSALFWNGTGPVYINYATNNTAIGVKAMFNNRGGSFNTAIGTNSLYLNDQGGANVAIGNNALQQSKGSQNTAVGVSAMSNHESGLWNVAVGRGALENNVSGEGNVAIGFRAGFNEMGSNKLYINNMADNENNTLIYGDFAADSLLLNAKTINKFSLNVRGSNALEMGYGTAGKQTDAGKISYGGFGDPPHWLGIVGGGTQVDGNDRVIKLWSEGGLRIRGNTLPDFNNFYSLGSSTVRWKEVWTNAGAINTSDANLKTNISASPYGLNEVMRMHPVQYNWKSNPNEDLQIGFLAQDIQKIVPEAIVVPANGDPLGMKYTELIPVLVKAIQELQNEVSELKKQLKK